MVKNAIGVVLLVAGFVALVTPFTPGSWLIFVGAEILGIEFLTERNLRALWQRLRRR